MSFPIIGEFKPDQTPGCCLYLRADRAVLDSNGNAVFVADLSGNRRHLVRDLLAPYCQWPRGAD